MKKIAIIEPGIRNHTPIIVNWAKICDLKGWELTVYTTQECFSLVEKKLIDTNSFIGVVFIDTLTIKSLFKYIREFRRFDHVLIASLYEQYLTYFLLCFFCQNFSLTVHNVNKWFAYKKTSESLFQSIKNRINFLLKRGIIKSINKVIVNSHNQKDYLISTYGFSDLEVIPFKMNFTKKTNKNINKIKVVYPGIISSERKKYSNFIFLAEKYPNADFILLGELKNDKVGEYIVNQILTKNLKNIIFFREYVTNECFDSYMKDSNLIFSDINVRSGAEVYGKSKDSGASYLMAEYALPFIVNSEFNNLSCLNSATSYFYDRESLINVFEALTTQDRVIEDKINGILEARKVLSLEHVSNEFGGFS